MENILKLQRTCCGDEKSSRLRFRGSRAKRAPSSAIAAAAGPQSSAQGLLAAAHSPLFLLILPAWFYTFLANANYPLYFHY